MSHQIYPKVTHSVFKKKKKEITITNLFKKWSKIRIKYSKRGFRQASPVATALHRTDKREIVSLQICFSFPTDDTTSYV